MFADGLVPARIDSARRVGRMDVIEVPSVLEGSNVGYLVVASDEYENIIIFILTYGSYLKEAK